MQINASSDVSSSFGVTDYRISVQTDLLLLEALDGGGSALTTVELHGKDLDKPGDLKALLRDPFAAARHGNIQHSIAKGRWGSVQVDPGQAPAPSLSGGPAPMHEELKAYGLDLAEQIHGNKAKATDQARMPDAANRVMDTACFIAGAGVGFWPIGTLIFGPTAVGCVVWYMMGSP